MEKSRPRLLKPFSRAYFIFIALSISILREFHTRIRPVKYCPWNRKMARKQISRRRRYFFLSRLHRELGSPRGSHNRFHSWNNVAMIFFLLSLPTKKNKTTKPPEYIRLEDSPSSPCTEKIHVWIFSFVNYIRAPEKKQTQEEGNYVNANTITKLYSCVIEFLVEFSPTSEYETRAK